MFTAGSIREVNVGGRPFAVAADSDSTRRLGGFQNEFQANGNGSARKIMTRTTWMVGGLALSIDDALGDQEYLQSVADSPANVPISFTFADGSTYSGTGSITDELAKASQAGTMSCGFAGPGKLVKQ